MYEGEQLQQVEPGQLGITQPLAYERCIEDDVRSFGRPRYGLAPARLPRLAVTPGNPDAGVRRVKGREGERDHLATLSRTRTKLEQRISG